MKRQAIIREIHESSYFSDFDKSNSGKITLGSLQVKVSAIPLLPFFTIELLQAAMRRGGVNPTDVEMVSIINKHDNTSGYIDIKVYRQQMSEGNV